MKITVDIDCTPQEARAFLGLPDVRPMQEKLMQELQERMVASLNAMGPEELLKSWFPLGRNGFEQMQELLQKMASVKRE